MTRSRKKHPFCGMTCATSEKWDKERANRRLRMRNKRVLRATEDADEMFTMREMSNIAWFAKDGKHRFTSKDGMRK